MPKFDMTDIEVVGQNLLMYLSHMEAESTLPYMKKHHLPEQIDPNQWYPAKNVCDFLWDIASSPNAIYSLVSIGVESIRLLELPPEAEHLPLVEAVNALLGAYYHTVLRGGDVGYVKAEQIDPKCVKVICVTPLPDDGWYGAVYGMARRFLPKNTEFTVKYDETHPRMDHGGDETIIYVTWV